MPKKAAVQPSSSVATHNLYLASGSTWDYLLTPKSAKRQKKAKRAKA